MKDSLVDLNQHLFAQLERLGEEELCSDPEKLELEIRRAGAMSGVADRIIHNANVVLKAQVAFSNGESKFQHPMLKHSEGSQP